MFAVMKFHDLAGNRGFEGAIVVYQYEVSSCHPDIKTVHPALHNSFVNEHTL